MLSIKEGIKLKGLQAEILIGFLIVLEVFKDYGFDVIITEGTGGTHLPDSLHYKGLALDLRSKHISNTSIKHIILSQSKQFLGSNFDMILEDEGLVNEHFHLEFQPKDI